MATANAPIHTLVYGDSGSGKSTFAATYPKPMLVWMWDPWGKETPYLKRGEPSNVAMDSATPYRDVTSRNTGKLLVRVEYYLDADFTSPEAYHRFLTRMARLQQEYDQWATCVFDSVTFAELTARKWHQYALNRTAKDGRQWFGGSTDLIEEMLMGRLAALPMNVVVCAHVDEDKDELHGTFVRTPKMPGQRLRKGVMAAFSEVYRACITKDEQGQRTHVLQTRGDNQWAASSQIGAPDPAYPDYKALWQPEVTQ